MSKAQRKTAGGVALNQIIETMLSHRSVRKYTGEVPTDEQIQLIVRAGQQAAFAAQLYSILLSRKTKHAFGAPLMFTICVDFHKMQQVMTKRDWQPISNDLSILLMGMQDAAYMTQNMILAAESMGIGSCLLGSAPYRAKQVAEQYSLPPKVFPMVQLVMGYPDEQRPPRPRYPLEFVLFEDKYPEMSDELVERAMRVMDEGYLAQDYYHRMNAKIKITQDRQDTSTYEDYSWCEHMCRKWGQWHESIDEILQQLGACGFDLAPGPNAKRYTPDT